MTYSITRSNGRSTQHDTYAAAVDACKAEWPGCEIGHDGDLTGGGERTLVWETEADSIDDDGACAVASICTEMLPGTRVECDDDTGTVRAHGIKGGCLQREAASARAKTEPFRRLVAPAHTKRAYKCTCGKVVHGNAGRALHMRMHRRKHEKHHYEASA